MASRAVTSERDAPHAQLHDSEVTTDPSPESGSDDTSPGGGDDKGETLGKTREAEPAAPVATV